MVAIPPFKSAKGIRWTNGEFLIAYIKNLSSKKGKKLISLKILNNTHSTHFTMKFEIPKNSLCQVLIFSSIPF